MSIDYLEAVTTCVEYGDVLGITLPRNRAHFDAMFVVTSLDDEETREVCTQHDAVSISTDAFFEDGGRFRKSRGINTGLARMRKADWVLVMDCDIILPENFREVLDEEDLAPDCLYACRRHLYRTHEHWSKRDTIEPESEEHLERRNGAGRGFFQLFHASSSAWTGRYPEQSGDASVDDIAFQRRWPAARRKYLPFHVAHLGEIRTNWQGRVSPRFEPA